MELKKFYQMVFWKATALHNTEKFESGHLKSYLLFYAI
jgi:hypothetical protein